VAAGRKSAPEELRLLARGVGLIRLNPHLEDCDLFHLALCPSFERLGHELLSFYYWRPWFLLAVEQFEQARAVKDEVGVLAQLVPVLVTRLKGVRDGKRGRQRLLPEVSRSKYSTGLKALLVLAEARTERA
jgi:hypothetical protein